MAGWGSIYNNAMWGISYHTNNLARLQEQISSGSKVIRYSDDPANAYRIATLADTAKSMDEYASNIGIVEASLNGADNAMSSMSDLITRADVLITQASSGTYQGENRLAMGEEIDSILEQMIGLANHKVLSKYIFAGADSQNAPYSVTRENGKIASVTYEGSQAEQPVPVAPGVNFSGQLVGDAIFRSNRRREPELLGNTGAAGGVGTSNVRGDIWLDVGHTTTDFNTAATGLTAGMSSGPDDTILGAHSVTIDTVAQTISLDGGDAVSYLGTETNLQLTNSSGDVAHVDVTGALVTGTFNITGNGELSINNGPASAIDFTDDNISVTNPDTGRFLYIDGQNITRAGSEAVRVPGTGDLFNTLVHVRDMMLNTRGLSTEEQTNHLTRAGESLGEISNTFRQRITIVGGRLGGLDQLSKTIETLSYNNTSQASSLQEADIVELATELARSQTLYQASLQVAGKALSLSLMDYIK